ncbi:MAG: proline dehydrogenase family protein [Myxococcales bacterium]|nr:proline dehydrogenase family protein [Myxococcales bacterium]
MWPKIQRAIAQSLPHLPRPIISRVARRYIAGSSLTDAITTAKDLATRGFRTTIDFLGEDTQRPEQANEVVAEYLRLLAAIGEFNLPGGVSVKLTQLGLRFDPDQCVHHLKTIVNQASKVGRFVRVDMEDSSVVGTTLDIVRSLRKSGMLNVGSVLQAYLRRTADDVDTYLQTGGDVRFCKGIYRESEELAFQNRNEITQNFIIQTQRLLEAGVYVGIATHDTVIISAMEQYLQQRGVDKNRYEFQALLGVPITARLKRLVSDGHKVRIYIPYGTHWYAYSLRRLKENPDVVGAVLRSMVRWDR